MLDGDVIVPGSARYANARLLWDTRFDLAQFAGEPAL